MNIRLLALMTACIQLASWATCQGEVSTTGHFPKVHYSSQNAGGLASARTICSDRFGWTYVGDRYGILRFDGLRWERVYTGESVAALVYDGRETLYGLVTGGIGKWKIEASESLDFVSFEEPILDQGLVSAGAFRDIHRVGDYVYATKTEAMVRMRLRPDGTDEIVVLKAGNLLPKEFKFRRIRPVGGRQMVQVERRTSYADTRFGWLDENDEFHMLPRPADPETKSPMLMGVVDFQENPSRSGEILAVTTHGTSRNIVKINEEGFRILPPWSDESLTEVCPVPNKISILSANRFIATSTNGGALIIDADGNILMSIDATQIPSSTSGFHADSQGRYWFPTRVGAIALHSNPDIRVWDLPEDAVIRAIRYFDGAIVASTPNGLFYAKVSPDTFLPTEPFKYVARDGDMIMSIDSVGGRLLESRRLGLVVSDSLEDLADPVPIPFTERLACYDVCEGFENNEIVACFNAHGLIRARFVNGAWEKTEQHAEPRKRFSPFRDGAGNVWTQCQDHLDRSYICRLTEKDGEVESKLWDLEGDTFLLGGQVFLFSPLPVGSKLDSRKRNWEIKRLDPTTDEFVPEETLTQLLSEKAPLDFQPSRSLRDSCVTRSGDLLMSGGTSCLLRISRLGDHEYNVESVLELEQPGAISCSVEGPGGMIWVAEQNRLRCLVTNSRQKPTPQGNLPSVLFTHIGLSDGGSEAPNATSAALASDPLTWMPQERRSISFDHSSSTLSIAYSVPTARNSAGVLFQTKMIGISDNWSAATKRADREYPSLWEGAYEFSVRAIFPDGSVSSPSLCSITIHPPWYRTTLSKVLLTSFVVLSIAGFMRWRLWAHQVQVAKLKKEVADRIEAERQLKSTQRALLNQERMRAMGEMAAGVAHDVNNALAPISAFSELISIDKESPDRIRKMAALALKSSRDAAEIIRRIQPLYWGEKTNTDNVAVHTLIAEVVSSVQALNNTPSVEPQKKISLIKDVVPAHFCCSPTELREVLTNLLTNAVGAIEEAGTIKVGCRVDEDQTVCIFVEDDGKGMNEATLKSCFSTFFSTKGRYGSGLGLSTSQAIITSYGGSISVKSEEGVGTRFDIRLPKLERAETPEESVPVEGDTTREHVLLVEDIESTQQAIASLITALGHDVTCVGSANEAIGALGQHHGFTIVLTDYGLPQQPGTELCRQVRTEHPMVCTILMTGNELPAMRELADGFLCKPVDLQALQKTIEQVCQKRETRARRVG